MYVGAQKPSALKDYTGLTNRGDHHADTLRFADSCWRDVPNAAALARQPQRLAIVHVQRAMTVTEFNQAHPSSVPLEELALLNQLAGPEAVMPLNFQAKRVVVQ